MSCQYFILTKSSSKDVNDDSSTQIISMDSSSRVYILPKNIMDYYVSHGLFEKGLIQWVKQFCQKDRNMLDIGAHTGTYTISLADSCKHVYAFEPQKMTYYSLCGSIALSNIRNVTCINMGLGNEDQVGTQVLNIVSLDGGGSTLLHSINNNVLATEQIEIKTLDSFNIDNISFIKMDVEENELNVLLSATETLKRSNYPKILFEMNSRNEKIVEFLEELHYHIIQINGFSNMFLASI